MSELIYKQDAIKTIKDADVFVAYHEKDPIDEAVDEAIRATKRSVIYDIEMLPSAELERKKGKWLLIDAGYYDYVKCSQCGETLVWGKNFCPNCGADMRQNNAPLPDDDSIYG